MSNEITLEQGFPDELRLSAAELYDDAFGTMLAIAIPNQISRVAVLVSGFNPEFCFVAIYEGEMLGIAGFKTEKGSLTGRITFRLLKDELGFWRATRAIAALALFHRKRGAGQLLMDGIVVSSKMRGIGIGTMLLHSLIRYSEAQGYQSVRLDVVDTNPVARRLYERVGFVPVKTEQFGYLKWLLGFEAFTQMEYSKDLI